MAVVDCFINLFRCNEQTVVKSWPLLLRLEKDRFSSLEGLKAHFKDRLKEPANEHGVENFVCVFYLVHKNTNRKEKYEIESDPDWQEYLPFLLEDTRYALRINVLATSVAGANVQVNGISHAGSSRRKSGPLASPVQPKDTPPKNLSTYGKTFDEKPQKPKIKFTRRKLSFPSKGHTSNASATVSKSPTKMAAPYKITSTNSKPDASTFETTPWQQEASPNNFTESCNNEPKSIVIAASSKKTPPRVKPRVKSPPPLPAEEGDTACERLSIMYNFKTRKPQRTQEEPVLSRQTALSPRQIRRSLRRKTLGGKDDEAEKAEARKQVHHGIERLMVHIRK